MRPIAKQAQDDPHLLFLPGVFDETLALLFEAHHYFQTHGNGDNLAKDEASSLLYAAEMSRITMRLTSVMAWIMIRRAVTAGRLESKKAANSYRLDDGDICLDSSNEILRNLPHYMGYLSQRSHELYERVHRLDELAYGEKASA